MVDAVDDGARATGLQRGLVALDQAPGEILLGRPDRAGVLVVELDRDVGDAAGRDVLGDVDLATAHDAHVDDGLARRGVERVVRRGQVGLLQRLHQTRQRLGVVDPAQELPDRAEVLDVVDQRGAGERHQQRAGGPGAEPLGELEHVARALRRLVLDEVRLVDHHAAEAERAEPADVPVEDLVVDDDDVGEGVDLAAVTVDHGGAAAGRPALGLAGPVGLDDVGAHHEQRVGVGGLRGEQRLRGLAEAGLVGQEEGAVPLSGGGDHARLVRHQLELAGGVERGGLGQVHARGGAAELEGAEQRAEQLPRRQPAVDAAALTADPEVGDEEGVGQLVLEDGLRHHAALAEARAGLVVGLRLLGRDLDAGLAQHLQAQVAGGVGDDGVLGEQAEEGGVAGRGLGEDRRDAVEALELVGLLGVGELGRGAYVGAVLAHQQRDHLEADPLSGGERATLDGRLELAHRSGQDGDDALVVLVAGVRRGAASCRVDAGAGPRWSSRTGVRVVGAGEPVRPSLHATAWRCGAGARCAVSGGSGVITAARRLERCLHCSARRPVAGKCPRSARRAVVDDPAHLADRPLDRGRRRRRRPRR